MSKVWLFVGGAEVTSKKTKETFQLKPGQTVSVGKDGKIVVKKFDIEQGAKRFGILTKDADLNFLDLNETLMKKLNLQKKGTATVAGKQCDHYVGTNVEFYVWKGLVIKKVQKGKNGVTTIHEVTSIEQPTSIDPKMFKMPNGYTVK